MMGRGRRKISKKTKVFCEKLANIYPEGMFSETYVKENTHHESAWEVEFKKLIHDFLN